ncbi:hypothetical protein DFJ74DRAFT_662913 [Hyaloraphidium curvatum]|nr:hypothetical protein DFJ74DRAFT_662913 [Hyaloraphidium curvatum]
MGNVAVFGDAARTGHFVSGMGMNSIISIDSQAIVTLAKALRSGADPAASFSAYSKSILDTAKAWHTATHPLHNEKWPGWVPDADHAAPRVGGELAGPVRTEIRLASLDGFVRYVLANLALNYLVPFGFLRRWVRSVAEWAFSSGVQRIEYVPKKA